MRVLLRVPPFAGRDCCNNTRESVILPMRCRRRESKDLVDMAFVNPRIKCRRRHECGYEIGQFRAEFPKYFSTIDARHDCR
eukprot:scaffold158661_cov47-Cyclotella_meneghiniana.AAC.2